MPVNPGLILGAAQTAFGVGQLIAGATMKVKRPELQVSKEIQDISSTYSQLAQGGVPGAREAREDIARSTQNVIGQAANYASSGGALLGTLMQAQSTEARSLRQAEIDRQTQKIGLIGKAMEGKQLLAAEKQRIEQFNVIDPFEAKAFKKAALIGGGIQSIETGFKGMAGGFALGGGGGGGGRGSLS